MFAMLKRVHRTLLNVMFILIDVTYQACQPFGTSFFV